MDVNRGPGAPIVEAKAQIVWRAASSKLRTSYGAPPDQRPHVIVKLVDAEGRTGYGEASPLPKFTGESADGILLHLRRLYLPLLAGRSPFELTGVRTELERALPGNSSAKAAIDMALHDLMGRCAGLSVADLLGGRVRDSVPCTMPLGVEDIPATVTAAERAVARGIGTLKMKIGPEPDADIERVRAVRAAVGDGVGIRIDANQGYDVPTAMRVVGRLADIGIQYVEQPVAQWDHAGLAEVRRHTGVPIGADESLHTLRDAVHLIELGAVDFFMIKLIKTGGLGPARAIAELAAAHGIGIVAVSPFDTQIGTAAVLALALAAPTGGLAHELRVFDSQPEMADTDIAFRDGRVHPSGGAGLGVASIVEFDGLDWDAEPAPHAEPLGAI